jgi:16S rRNA (adenine1518-N6/adenine1519-N6)-dimethyltransferase
LSVRPKKHLGQHFLNDQNIARNIVDALSGEGYKDVLEIGPGMGVLTQYLLKEKLRIYAIEVDSESVEYLNQSFPLLGDRLIQGDFLKLRIEDHFQDQLAIIGNFPYNISSQIVF